MEFLKILLNEEVSQILQDIASQQEGGETTVTPRPFCATDTLEGWGGGGVAAHAHTAGG